MAALAVQSAAGALAVGGVAFAAGRRAAHAEDPDFDLDDSITPLNCCLDHWSRLSWNDILFWPQPKGHHFFVFNALGIVQLCPLPAPRGDGRRTAAFFDVDGTLYSINGDPTGGGTALLHTFRVSRECSALKGAALGLLMLPIILAMFVLDKADRALSMWFMTSLSLHGVDTTLVETSVQKFCASPLFRSMVVESVREQLERHRAAGHLIILVSASSLVITRPIGKAFGAHIVCGSMCPRTTAANPDNQEARMKFARAHYRNALLVGDVKQRLLARLFDQYAIDAPRSFAYSDHPTDAPMLRTVGETYTPADCRLIHHHDSHNFDSSSFSRTSDAANCLLPTRAVSGNPVAANPTGKMRRLAQAEGWAVLEGECSLDVGGSASIGNSCIAGADSSGEAEASIPASLHNDYSIASAGVVQGAAGIVGAIPMLFSAAFGIPFGTGGGKL